MSPNATLIDPNITSPALTVTPKRLLSPLPLITPVLALPPLPPPPPAPVPVAVMLRWLAVHMRALKSRNVSLELLGAPAAPTDPLIRETWSHIKAIEKLDLDRVSQGKLPDVGSSPPRNFSRSPPLNTNSSTLHAMADSLRALVTRILTLGRTPFVPSREAVAAYSRKVAYERESRVARLAGSEVKNLMHELAVDLAVVKLKFLSDFRTKLSEMKTQFVAESLRSRRIDAELKRTALGKDGGSIGMDATERKALLRALESTNNLAKTTSNNDRVADFLKRLKGLHSRHVDTLTALHKRANGTTSPEAIKILQANAALGDAEKSLHTEDPASYAAAEKSEWLGVV